MYFCEHGNEPSEFIKYAEFLHYNCEPANSPTLAVAASKLDIYQMLYVQFELLMTGGKTA
jgi:hypothetical protein